MANPVLMPKQGITVESCILNKWNVKVGDTVKKGDVLFSYETDKSAFDQEAEFDGEVLAIFAEEGDEVRRTETAVHCHEHRAEPSLFHCITSPLRESS